MSDYTDTWYARTLTENVSRPALTGANETDVCVIGGGLAGLNVALGLAERGIKAVVLEGRRVGFGASGRNGGKVLTGYAGGIDKMLKRVDLPHAKKLYALTVRALPLIRKRIADYAIDCGVEGGVMICAWYGDETESLRADQRFETEQLGLRVDFVPREKLRELYRTERYHDGLFYPGYFHLQPLEYTRGLARAFEARGGRVFEGSMAESVVESTDGVTVTTAQGSVRAKRVVYCTSAYSNGIAGALERAAVPVSSYMMATEALSAERLASAIRAPYGVYDTRWALDYYRPLPDGRILWGGGVGIGIGNHRLPARAKDQLLANLLKVYPQLAGIGVDSCWAGTMASTVHRLPHVGRFNERIWYATNFGNNGIGPTAAAGEVIAAGIAGENDDWRLFAPFGLDYAGGVFGPLAAQAIYRSWQARDKIKQWKQDRVASGKPNERPY